MTEAISTIPWLICLAVFGGMAALLWRALSALDDLAKLLAQLLGQISPRAGASALVPPPAASAPASPVPAPPPAQPPSPSPSPAPTKSGPFADYPDWFQWALHEIGFHETGNNGGLDRYIQLAHCGANGEPWCAIFANAALEATGHRGTRSPSSQSFRTDPNFVKIDGPAPGAIAIFERGPENSGLGHVTFYRGEDATRVWGLGGNENDMVQIEALPKSSASFRLIGYWWPKGVPLPKTGAVVMPAGSPAHIQSPPKDAPAAPPASADGLQRDIVATVFTSHENPQTAYGGPLDDSKPSVALPFHFQGQRPLVEVINPKTGASVVCSISDVGPWNINDPYWQTGTRPAAEGGVDRHGRHTNRAGIDLNLAAAKAIGIDGRGLVNWRFVSDETKIPKVT